jgi:hypothetical protein
MKVTKDVMLNNASSHLLDWHGADVNELKDVLPEMTYKEAAQYLDALEGDLQHFKDLTNKLRELKDHLTIKCIPEKLDEDGMANVTVIMDDGTKRRWQTRADIRCSVLASHRQDLYHWLDEHGHESLITETVNASTLKAFLKEEMKAGRPIPTEYLSLHPYEQASLVKN